MNLDEFRHEVYKSEDCTFDLQYDGHNVVKFKVLDPDEDVSGLEVIMVEPDTPLPQSLMFYLQQQGVTLAKDEKVWHTFYANEDNGLAIRPITGGFYETDARNHTARRHHGACEINEAYLKVMRKKGGKKEFIDPSQYEQDNEEEWVPLDVLAKKKEITDKE